MAAPATSAPPVPRTALDPASASPQRRDAAPIVVASSSSSGTPAEKAVGLKACFPFREDIFVRDTFAVPAFQADVFVSGLCGAFVSAASSLDNASAAAGRCLPQGTTRRAVAEELGESLQRAIDITSGMAKVELRDFNKSVETCKESEMRERSRLQQVRGAFADFSVALTDVQDKLSTATALTAGVEQHMSLASARVARGRAIHQLITYFNAMTSLNAEDLATLLSHRMSDSREKARQAVTEGWCAKKANRRAVEKGKGSSVAPGSPKGSTTAFAAAAATSSSQPGASSTISSFQSLQLFYAAEANDRAAEEAATATSLPIVFSRRSSVEEAIDWMGKLKLVAAQMGDAAEAAHANIDTYEKWLEDEFVADFHCLVSKFRNLCLENAKNRSMAPSSTGAAVNGASAFANAIPSDPVPTDNESVEVAISSYYGRSLLQGLSTVSALYSRLTTTVGPLYDIYLDQFINDVVIQELVPFAQPPSVQLLADVNAAATGAAAAPHMGDLLMPMFQVHRRELMSMSHLVRGICKREAPILRAGFAFVTGAKDQLVFKMFEHVRALVADLIKVGDDRRREAITQESRMTEPLRRRCVGRYIDAMAYQLSVFSEARKMMSELTDHLIASESLSVTLRDLNVNGLFISPEEYAASDAEVTLLRRVLDKTTNDYHSKLSVADGQPYEVFVEHTEKMRAVTVFANDALVRSRVVGGESASYTKVAADIVFVSQKWLAAYVVEELQKVFAMLKDDAKRNWLAKLPVDALAYCENPPTNDAHLRAVGFLTWAQSVVVEMMRMGDGALAPMFNDYPDLRETYQREWAEALKPVNELGCQVTTLVAHAIVTRSLNVLLKLQQPSDYRLKESKAGADEAFSATKAAICFNKYLSAQLRYVATTLKPYSIESAERDARKKAAVTGNVAVAGALAGLTGATMGDSLASPTRVPTSSSDVPSTSSAGAAKRMSFARMIGLGLFKGIKAHLVSQRINDHGAQLFVRDVQLYITAAAPLLEHPTDGTDIRRWLDTLTLIPKVLTMPIDNIGLMRRATHLQYFSKEEWDQVLMIHDDLRDMIRTMDR